MWLSRLDLMAFGRFSNVRLNLGPGFHLIYGPNEAGKSTTLRAIRQLLFGFDERPSDNFIHPNANLRVGGIICDNAAEELAFIRRKTRKDSLRGLDDSEIIDSSRLEQLLCGIDEETFSQRYGIDYQQLVEGGKEIASGSGDLGEILFAAGSGVTDLTAIQDQLAEEAAELFRPLGKKQRLNLALAEWQQEREKVLEKMLPVSEWEEADGMRQDVESQIDRVSRELSGLVQERDLFRAWQQASTLLEEQQQLEQQLAAFPSTLALPSDFVSTRQEAVLVLNHANEQEQSALKSLETARGELERLAISPMMLERTDDLTRLFTEWGSYHKAQIDRPGLVNQNRQLTSRIAELRDNLDESSVEVSTESIALDREQRSQMTQLGLRRARLVQALRQTEEQIDRLDQQLGETESNLEALPNGRPIESLQESIQKIRMEGDLEAQLEKVRDEASVLQNEFQRQFERLGLWTRSVDELRSMRIPAPETIEKFAAQIDTNQADLTQQRVRLAELHEERRDLNQQIETLQREFHVPTEAELVTARQNRQAAWSKIRSDAETSVVPAVPALESFEQLVSETDELADRLRTEADRVAQLADHLSNRTANEKYQQTISSRLETLDAEEKAIEERWSALWPDLAEVLSPREMQTWVVRRETLLQSDEIVRAKINEAIELAERIKGYTAALGQLLLEYSSSEMSNAAPQPHIARASVSKKVGKRQQSLLRQQRAFDWISESASESELIEPVDGETTKRGLGELLNDTEELLKTETDRLQKRRDYEETTARLTSERREALAQLQQRKDDLDAWKAAWQAAMTDLGLPTDSTPETAVVRIETLGEITDLRRQAEGLGDRIQGIDADAKRFDENLRSICRELAPDQIESSIEVAVTTLRNRLAACQRDQAIFNEQTVRQEQAEKQLSLARQSRANAQSQISSLCRMAGLADADEAGSSETSLEQALEQLERIEEQWQQRNLVAEKLERVREQMCNLANGKPVDDFVTQARSQTVEQIAVLIQDLERKISDLDAERDRLNQQLGGIKERLQRMDGSANAAEAEEKQRQWLAQIRSDAEQYVRARLASAVLRSAIERYREKIRGPVLNVAGDLFRELTLGSFEGLRVDEDDHHKPVLVGIRSGANEPVNVSGMSEGTCDQLYLALRIASLQLEAAPRSNLPFIVDDVLIQFDDARVTAALRVLAKLAKQRQVIFFTHHEHLLRIASDNLPGEVSEHHLPAHSKS